MTDGRSEAIDWDLALATARRFAPSGPDLSREEAHSAVAMLRDLAREAVEPVRAVTGLVAPESSPAVVVDRTAWIASNMALTSQASCLPDLLNAFTLASMACA